MSPERYEQIGRLYQAALECEPDARAAFLAEACGADDELRREVESLIAAEFWPQYLRGQAYLKLGRGAEALAEFQKILDHRGYAPLSVLYPLAHLELARAASLTGNAAQESQADRDFLALWKEADPDLPVLTSAKMRREVR
ncbi:MAG TPA: hypothetical protein VNQ79_05245 [Blastocatellia bacterium]|nr:hypothetical protein [Blastocatellia bacterium]